jgi:hypothetical protein
MREKSLTVIFLMIAQLVIAQGKNDKSIWHLIISDSVSSKGLERVTVFLSNGKVFITDSSGAVDIENRLLGPKEKLTISYVGYKTFTFPLQGRYPDTIGLSKSTIFLNEVKVKVNEKKIILGKVSAKYDGGYLNIPNEEVAEYIPNNTHLTGTIASVEFAIDNTKKGIGKPFKVNLYSKTGDSMYPGAILIKDSVIVYNPKKNAIVTVDISQYGIRVPDNGFFVGFETLSPSWYSDRREKSADVHSLHVPGIKGHFSNHDFVIDDTERKGVQYGLIRYINRSGEWAVLQEGTDFAIGATVNPD